jgi:general secretion pathway protein K
MNRSSHKTFKKHMDKQKGTDKQKGMALISALLVLALAAILAFSMIERGKLAVERSAQQQHAMQARALADGLFQFALLGLQKDEQASRLDALNETWAQPTPPLPVPQGSVAGQLFDLNGCINVNGLVSESAERKRFTRNVLTQLLVNLQLDVAIAAHIEDALDADDISVGSGEDVDFMAARPARRAPNRAVLHVNDLAHIPRIRAEDFAKLAPHLCAIDPNAKLNINTASMPVLMALDRNITEAVAKRLNQDGRNFETVSDFIVALSKLGVISENLATIQTGLSTRSTHFKAVALIRLDNNDFRHEAILDRAANQVLYRQFGGF